MKNFFKSFIMISIALIILCCATGCFGGGSSKYKKRDSSYPEKGYWGSDGYYNPSREEMQESIREAEEWIKNN